MKPLQHLHIDFAQPRQALSTAQRLLGAGVLLALIAAVFIAVQFNEWRTLRSPATSAAPLPEPGIEVPSAYRDTLRLLQQDLSFLEHSIERPVPAGITLLSLSAQQDSGDVVLTVQAQSAEKILALPAWLEPDVAQRQWKVEQMSNRAAAAVTGQSQSQGVLIGVLSCRRCAQR